MLNALVAEYLESIRQEFRTQIIISIRMRCVYSIPIADSYSCQAKARYRENMDLRIMESEKFITTNHFYYINTMNGLTVVGICTYNPAVQRWLRTLRVHFDGPCRLYLVNSTKELQSFLAQKFRCDVIDVQVAPDYWAAPSPGRFCRVWGCLADACLDHISTPFVLRTDVWDVVFQGDPRLHLNPPPNKVLIASESASLNEDDVNRRWLGTWHRFIPEGIVVNGGMICGRTTAVSVVAKILVGNPFGTAFDQSELIVLRNLFDEQFEYRYGFMETIYKTFQVRGAVEQGLFVDRSTGTPWCVVHGNGSTKPLLDSHYPITEADRALS